MIQHYLNGSANPEWLREVSFDIPDDPARVAPPDYEDAGPSFEELPSQAQLDLLERVTRIDPFYRRALGEFLTDLDESHFRRIVTRALDPTSSDASVGEEFRNLLTEYLQGVARARGELLTEVIP